MSEIWNLESLCRCCHSDGNFKSLQTTYYHDDGQETYAQMLQDIFGVTIKPPEFVASFAICETCMKYLEDAFNFKGAVLRCERKFEEYLQNEQLNSIEVKTEDIKTEGDYETDDKDFDLDLVGEYDDNLNNGGVEIEAKNEFANEVVVKVEPKEKKSIKKPTAKQSKKSTPNKLYEKTKTSDGKRYTCKNCSESFTSVSQITSHLFSRHSKQCHKCQACRRKFLYVDNLNKHRKLSQVGKQLQCDFCKRNFLGKCALANHVATHTRKPSVVCHICQKEYANKSTFRRHLIWHEGRNKKFVCDICGHGFNDKTNLNIHIQTVHLKLRNFRCDMCPKTFTAKKHLTIHYMKHTGEAFCCEICTKKFATPNSLRVHMITHENPEKKYCCKVCSKVFSAKRSYMAHTRTHLGEKPFLCSECGKDFTCKYSLNRHLDQHRGIKPHSCSECGFKFQHKTQLDRHIRRRHNPLPELLVKVKCPICKLVVKNMEKHTEAHTKRPYSCEYCQKMYPERRTLNRHIKVRHFGSRPHECDLCDKKYATSTALKNHKVRKHGMSTKKEISIDQFIPQYNICKSEIE